MSTKAIVITVSVVTAAVVAGVFGYRRLIADEIEEVVDAADAEAPAAATI